MTLYELNHLVRSALESSLDEEYWVQGELSDASAGYGGHFYGELVQKDELGEGIVARARVNCWARTYNLLRMRLYREAGQTLRAGMQVKLLVRVTFHEQYGYALNIQDIDSTFTLGDLARRRREILAQLEADGILHDNQQLPLPRLLNRIAVVSSERAAGYGDFCNQLSDNDYGLRFTTHLFPAVMQGQHVEESVIGALTRIASEADLWDVAVIIRGGGATGDLSDFDSYPLAACIAQFPLPVITGIGHERDETVLDHVAHTRVKTPTAAAAFIIDHQAQEVALLDNLQQRLLHSANEHIVRSRQRLEHIDVVLPLLFGRFRERGEQSLRECRQRLSASLAQLLQRERHRHELLTQRLSTADPQQMLHRGYSITWLDGHVLHSAAEATTGSELRTMLEDGELISIVKKHT
ncbi:MAG: exodeoxyribonuclease VII large subunit [Bacteroidaceae bacterium]|nr:exodeoxyribonuclease VII large subunit [Bacteroidaceae bacterium]